MYSMRERHRLELPGDQISDCTYHFRWSFAVRAAYSDNVDDRVEESADLRRLRNTVAPYCRPVTSE